MSPPPITVAIIEDESVLREGFGFMIERSPGMKCVALCPSGEDALHELPGLCPNVALVDVNLGGLTGIECIRALKEKCPNTQFLVLTAFDNDRIVFDALRAGASGYILKTVAPAKLIESIRDLHDGGAPMSAQIARRVLEFFRTPGDNTRSASKVETPELPVTGREREVLELLARGHLYKEIAEKLGISIETVRKHLGRIYAKLHVKSRTEAVLKFIGKT